MKKQKKTTIVLFIVSLVVSCILFCFWMSKKSVWFCDEIYTLESSNGMGKIWPRNITNEWLSGNDMVEYYAATGNGLDYSGISNSLYDDHVPLYFWMFRTVSWLLFRGEATFAPGIVINALFFLVSFSLTWFILLKVTDNSVASFVISLLSFNLFDFFLAQETMIRMYMMLMADAFILLSCGYWILSNAYDKKYKVLPFIVTSLVGAMGLLTHYDYWIFYAVTASLFCSIILILSIKRNGFKFLKSKEFFGVLSWVASFIVSMLITIKLFVYCIWNIRRDKGKMALESVYDLSISKIVQILKGFAGFADSVTDFTGITVVASVLIVAVISVGGIILYKSSKTKELINYCLTIAVALAYITIVAFTMPAEFEMRYFWCAYSILLILLMYAGYLILEQLKEKLNERKKNLKAYYISVSVLLVMFSFVKILQIDGGHSVPYLFEENKDESVLKEYAEIPWIKYGGLDAYSAFDFVIPNEFCIIDFSDKEKSINVLKEKECCNSFILYCHEDYLNDASQLLEEAYSCEVETEQLTQSVNNTVYLVSLSSSL